MDTYEPQATHKGRDVTSKRRILLKNLRESEVVESLAAPRAQPKTPKALALKPWQIAEQKVAQMFRENGFHVIENLRFSATVDGQRHQTQIDCIAVSNYEVVLIEVKNWSNAYHSYDDKWIGEEMDPSESLQKKNMPCWVSTKNSKGDVHFTDSPVFQAVRARHIFEEKFTHELTSAGIYRENLKCLIVMTDGEILNYKMQIRTWSQLELQVRGYQDARNMNSLEDSYFFKKRRYHKSTRKLIDTLQRYAKSGE